MGTSLLLGRGRKEGEGQREEASFLKRKKLPLAFAAEEGVVGAGGKGDHDTRSKNRAHPTTEEEVRGA